MPRVFAPSNSARHRSHPQPQGRTVLYIGDVAVSTSASVLETLLGSCVAVCLFDPARRIGGMNHILLPHGASSADDMRSGRLGIHAMELLINRMMKEGADRRSLVAKAFGGASVFEGVDTIQIGRNNAAFVRSFLELERIPLVAQRLGGGHAVHLYFYTDTGKAIVRTVDGSALPKVVQDEDSYRHVRAAETDDGDITLF